MIPNFAETGIARFFGDTTSVESYYQEPPNARKIPGVENGRGERFAEGAKTKHLNAKVTPKLFEAAAKRVGTTSPAAVITAGLAAIAAEDGLGPWLAKNWGILADVDPEILDMIDL